jgi:hypothetical protein
MTCSQRLGIKDTSRDETLEGLAMLPYYERLTRFIRGSVKHWVSGGVTVIDFRPLYTVTIHHLQRQLAEQIHEIQEKETSSEQLETVRRILHKYSKNLPFFKSHSDRACQRMHCGILSLSTLVGGIHIL